MTSRSVEARAVVRPARTRRDLRVVRRHRAQARRRPKFEERSAPGCADHRASMRPSDGGYTGKTTAFLSGFENPVPVMLAGDGALFVGDWTSGKLYRITA